MKTSIIVLVCFLITLSASSCQSRNSTDDAATGNYSDEDWDFVNYKDQLMESMTQTTSSVTTTTQTTTTADMTESLGIGYVVGGEEKGFVLIYSQPDEKSNTLGTVAHYETIEIFGFNDGWLKVRYDDIEGYMLGKDVKFLMKGDEFHETSTETTSTTTSTSTTTTTTTTVPQTTTTETLPSVVSEAFTHINIPQTPVYTEPAISNPPTYTEPDYSARTPFIGSASVYCTRSENGEGYTYYADIIGDYDYFYVTWTFDVDSEKPYKYEKMIYHDETPSFGEHSYGKSIRVYITPYCINGSEIVEGETYKVPLYENPYV